MEIFESHKIDRNILSILNEEKKIIKRKISFPQCSSTSFFLLLCDIRDDNNETSTTNIQVPRAISHTIVE